MLRFLKGLVYGFVLALAAAVAAAALNPAPGIGGAPAAPGPETATD